MQKPDLMNDAIEIKWNVINKEGKAKIWLATTNNFKTGGKDEYKLVAEVPVADGKARIDVKQIPSDFYKIVIEMPYNFLNRWVVVKEIDRIRSFRKNNQHVSSCCNSSDCDFILVQYHMLKKINQRLFLILLLLLASLKIFLILHSWMWCSDKLFVFSGMMHIL